MAWLLTLLRIKLNGTRRAVLEAMLTLRSNSRTSVCGEHPAEKKLYFRYHLTFQVFNYDKITAMVTID